MRVTNDLDYEYLRKRAARLREAAAVALEAEKTLRRIAFEFQIEAGEYSDREQVVYWLGGVADEMRRNGMWLNAEAGEPISGWGQTSAPIPAHDYGGRLPKRSGKSGVPVGASSFSSSRTIGAAMTAK